MKKGFQLKLVIMLLLLITESYAGPVKIYGFTNAQNFHTSSKGMYFIQAESFAKKNNAYHYRDLIQSKLKQQVRVEYSKNAYAVIVGPIKSVAEVQGIGQQLVKKNVVRNTISKKMLSNHIKNNLANNQQQFIKHVEPVHQQVASNSQQNQLARDSRNINKAIQSSEIQWYSFGPMTR